MRMVRCPHCQAELEVPDALLGGKVRCTECSKTFTPEAAKRRRKSVAPASASTKHRCPKCAAKIVLSAQQFGRTARCPKCDRRVTLNDSTLIKSRLPKTVVETRPVPAPPATPVEKAFAALELPSLADDPPLIVIHQSTEAAIVQRRKLPLRTLGITLRAVVACCLVAWGTYSFFRNPSIEEIVAANEASIAVVKSPSGVGTGFLIGDNQLVTNAHVIELALIEELEVHFPSADKALSGPHSVTLLYEDTKRDLAILEVESSLPPLDLATDHEFKRGENVVVIGNSGVGDQVVLKNAVSSGVMSTETTIDGQQFYQLGIAINSGNSGGPVLNSRGKVVGVVSMRAVEQESLAFCIPLRDLVEAINRVANQSEDDRQQATSRHRVIRVFATVKSLGDAYMLGLQTCTNAMQESIDGGGNAQTGLTTALAILAAPMKSIESNRTGAASLMTEVGSDQFLEEGLRSKMIELWTNTSEMHGYIDNPRGSFASFSEKYRELRDNHSRLSEGIRLTLGLSQ